MAGFDLGDNAWAVIEPLLPRKERGAARKDDRQILNGSFHISRAGARWRDPPQRLAPHTTVDNRCVRWGGRGVRRGIFETLATEREYALILVDSAIVNAHRRERGAFSQGIGRSRGGRGGKVHTTVDDLESNVFRLFIVRPMSNRACCSRIRQRSMGFALPAIRYSFRGIR